MEDIAIVPKSPGRERTYEKRICILTPPLFTLAEGKLCIGFPCRPRDVSSSTFVALFEHVREVGERNKRNRIALRFLRIGNMAITTFCHPNLQKGKRFSMHFGSDAFQRRTTRVS